MCVNIRVISKVAEHSELIVWTQVWYALIVAEIEGVATKAQGAQPTVFQVRVWNKVHAGKGWTGRYQVLPL